MLVSQFLIIFISIINLFYVPKYMDLSVCLSVGCWTPDSIWESGQIAMINCRCNRALHYKNGTNCLHLKTSLYSWWSSWRSSWSSWSSVVWVEVSSDIVQMKRAARPREGCVKHHKYQTMSLVHSGQTGLIAPQIEGLDEIEMINTLLKEITDQFF